MMSEEEREMREAIERIGAPDRPLKEDVADFIAAQIALIEAQENIDLENDK